AGVWQGVRYAFESFLASCDGGVSFQSLGAARNFRMSLCAVQHRYPATFAWSSGRSAADQLDQATGVERRSAQIGASADGGSKFVDFCFIEAERGGAAES
ncbi:MAG: hypothetical protein ABL996_25410, partial [Micropepsaceae bacterium]